MKAKNAIGIDIGGTKIRVGVVTPRGGIINSVRIPTEAAKGRSVVLKNVLEATKKVWTKDTGFIGIGIAGLVDHKKGVFLGGPNLPKALSGAKLSSIIGGQFKVPIKVDNDVHCFTLAEAALGAGKGKKLVVGLTFGTGIGGGITVDGHLVRGRNNAAGEFGHMTIGLGSKHLCSCGRLGHFESFASGRAMSKIYKSFTGKSLEPLEVEEAAARGDRYAKETISLMTEAVVSGLSGIIHALNPDVVVVGGGLSAVKAVWQPVMNKMKSNIAYPELRSTPIVRSKLGTDANIIGAAMLAKE